MKTALRTLTAAALAGAALVAFTPVEFVAAAAVLRHAATHSEQNLTVHIVSPGSRSGEVWIGLYDSEAAYDDGDEMLSRTLPADSDELAAVFENLPAGEYGIIAFHDANADGDFNRNFMGIPSERYGFSNNPRPRFRAASWQEARFELSAEGPREVTIQLMGGIG